MSSHFPRRPRIDSGRNPAWRRHLRDPDVWHALVIASIALVGSAGVAWLLHFRQVWQRARSTPSTPPQPGHVLLFGKRLRDGHADVDLHARIECAHRLLQTDHVVSLILLGGSTDGGRSEAAVAHELLMARNLPTQVPVRLEEASGDTLENLRNARDLLAGSNDAKIVLLSSRYHLARCAQFAQQLGFDHEPCAAEPALSLQPGMLLRLLGEAGYVCWVDLGTRWARLIGHRRMLAKVT